MSAFELHQSPTSQFWQQCPRIPLTAISLTPSPAVEVHHRVEFMHPQVPAWSEHKTAFGFDPPQESFVSVLERVDATHSLKQGKNTEQGCPLTEEGLVSIF